MRAVALLTLAATAAAVAPRSLQAPTHLNSMIDLHAAHKPVLGLYAPANPRVGGPGGGMPGGAQRPASDAPPPPQKTPAELAHDALAYAPADFIFDGGMEHDFDHGYTAIVPFMQGLMAAGSVAKTPTPHLAHPIVVKMANIGDDFALAQQRVSRQLALGVSTIAFVEVDSAKELQAGLAAMRFPAKGGKRANDVGTAPAFWGMSESDYRKKADLWPLNPSGEITAWAIVETPTGLDHVREIAAVKGIAALFPGAGTLRGLYTTVDSTTKQRKFDAERWEASIQKVLAACKEFNVPCGYPANDPQTVEQRMKQGFSVFIAGWGDNGFKAVEYGKQASGR